MNGGRIGTVVATGVTEGRRAEELETPRAGSPGNTVARELVQGVTVIPDGHGTRETPTFATLLKDVHAGPHMIVRERWHGGVPSHIISRARVRLCLRLPLRAGGTLGCEGDPDDAATAGGDRLEPVA